MPVSDPRTWEVSGQKLSEDRQLKLIEMARGQERRARDWIDRQLPAEIVELREPGHAANVRYVDGPERLVLLQLLERRSQTVSALERDWAEHSAHLAQIHQTLSRQDLARAVAGADVTAGLSAAPEMAGEQIARFGNDIAAVSAGVEAAYGGQTAKPRLDSGVPPLVPGEAGDRSTTELEL